MVERCVPRVSSYYLATRLSKALFHSFVNHDYIRIKSAQKKVLELKKIEKLQHIIES